MARRRVEKAQEKEKNQRGAGGRGDDDGGRQTHRKNRRTQQSYDGSTEDLGKRAHQPCHKLSGGNSLREKLANTKKKTEGGTTTKTGGGRGVVERQKKENKKTQWKSGELTLWRQTD